MYVCISDTYNITFACDKVSDTVPFNVEVVMLELELSKEHYFLFVFPIKLNSILYIV